MAHQRILLVDDEARVLDGLRRTLRGRYDVDTANSGAEGLAQIAAAEEPYGVVVADMMMPGMNGAEFLTRAHAVSADSVKMILSGQADLTSTISAVNNGNLFRFLTKPCEPAELTRALDAALAQSRLVHSERELLERTLDGAVGVLTELMSASNPIAFARTETVKALTEAVVEAFPVQEVWELRIAAMLGQVGILAVPGPVLAEVHANTELSAESLEIYRGHPQLSYDLIRRIPRLEGVAEWVAAQPVTVDDAMRPAEPGATPTVDDEEQFSGRDIYTAVLAFVVGIDAGLNPSTYVPALVKTGRYCARLLDATRIAHAQTVTRRPKQVKGEQLIAGMLVNQDVVTLAGLTLVRSGEILTESTAIRLRHFATGVGVVEPINVLV